MKIETVIFDLGGVLIDWEPRRLYRQLFDNEVDMEWFLNNICTPEWNAEQDRGRPLREAMDILQAQHPQYFDLIEIYYRDWTKMLGGAIEGTVELLQMVQKNYPTYALTNWSDQTFPTALELFDFLHSFKGVVVSGIEKYIKPDPKLFEIMIERFDLNPQKCVYIDDNAHNIQTSKALGFHSIHFLSPEQLKIELENYQVL
jgi:2-haloacid dehalogenase